MANVGGFLPDMSLSNVGGHPLGGRVATVDLAEHLKELGYVLSHQCGDMFGRLC